MNKFLAIGLCFILAGCSSVAPVIDIQQRSDLGISNLSPLVITTVQFNVVEQDGKLVVVMSLDDFQKLSRDMEDIQDRLQLDYNIIQMEEQYYNAPPPKPSK